VSERPDFEPYIALRRLERGPSADLYLARHATLSRQVWIKSLREHVPLSSSLAARLLREGEILAQLDHPNILDILDSVQRPPRFWLVLEAVDGWSLAEVLEARRRSGAPPLEVQGAIGLGLQLARALAHCHESGIVHGAVQPKHLLISKLGAAKLSGFSVATRLHSSEEDTDVDPEAGDFDLAYLSPEQVLGERVEARSDLFSLGVVLYELLTGAHPFRAPNERELGSNIRHAAAAPLREANPDVSPELERVIQRCLEKAAERRFESMTPLLRALEHLLGTPALSDVPPVVARALSLSGLPTVSSIPSARNEVPALQRRGARQHLERSLIGLVAVSGLLLAGGGALSAWVQAERPRAQDGAKPWTRESGGELLVVADPWANVFVDGDLLETTPFANPLRLRAGVHHVRLEHPDAVPERREVQLAAGQRLLLEVTLQLRSTGLDAGASDASTP
jgi:serine/threonine protein kinase